MTRARKPVYWKFEIDFIYRFWLIVKVQDGDPNGEFVRTDALNALDAKFGHSARIKGDGVKIRNLPDGAKPVNKSDWAWIVESEK